jgi:pSer/pThr/pTyr-binding forkhead associated (FHA) protein
VALRTNPDLRRGKFEVDCRNVSGDPISEPTPQVSPEESPEPQPLLSMVVNNSDTPPAVLSLPNGQRIELHEGHYVLGRHLESDIVLNDSNVSRRHAEFVCAAGEVTVRDMDSTNGTKVNGVAVSGNQLLQHGDVINFGTAQVRFEAS